MWGITTVHEGLSARFFGVNGRMLTSVGDLENGNICGPLPALFPGFWKSGKRNGF